MRKFIIIATGIYLILVSCFIFLSLLVQYPHLQSHKVAGIPLVFKELIPASLGFFLFLTGIFLIRRKQWARYLLLFLSAMALLIGLVIAASIIIFPALSPEPYYIRYPDKIILFFFWAIFCIAIPIFQLIFFTRKSVSELFTGAIPFIGRRPVGILVISAITTIGALVSAGDILFNQLEKDILLGNMIVPALYIKSYWIIICVISGVAAVDLWRMKRSGWIAAIVLQVVNIGSIMIMYFLMTDYNIAMRFASTYNINDFSRIPYSLIKKILLLNILMPYLILVYLISKRNLFKKGEQ